MAAATKILAQAEERANSVRVPLTQRRLGLGELLKRTAREVGDDHVGAFAASLSFHGLLALFPFSLLVLSLLGAVGATNTLTDLLDRFADALPHESVTLLRDQIFAVTEGGDTGLLTFSAIIAAALALWGISGAMRSVMEAMNVMYGVRDGRSLVTRYARSIGLALAVVALFLSALTLVVAGPQIAHAIADNAAFGQAFVWAWVVLQWPALIALVLLAFALVYYVAPDVEQRFRFVSPGAAIGVALWLAFSLLFSLYVNNFGSYNATYGTLAGVVVLLLYLYWSSFMLLVGAEINQVVEQANPAGKDEGQQQPGDSREPAAKPG